MISGKVGQLGVMRLWRDEPNKVLRVVEGMDERLSYAARCESIKSIERYLVIEVMLPRGARALYGLLGVRHIASTGSATLKVRVACSGSTGAIYKGSLIDSFETVTVGLPELYADAAVSGFERAFADGVDMQGGVVEIAYAAFGEVSSSEPFFERLGFALAKALSLSVEEVSVDTVGLYLFE